MVVSNFGIAKLPGVYIYIFSGALAVSFRGGYTTRVVGKLNWILSSVEKLSLEFPAGCQTEERFHLSNGGCVGDCFSKNCRLVKCKIYSPGKLTCPLKINGWFRCISYWNSPFFRGHVSFRGRARILGLVLFPICSPVQPWRNGWKLLEEWTLRNLVKEYIIPSWGVQ